MLLLGYYSDLIHSIGLTCFHSILDYLMAISGVLYLSISGGLFSTLSFMFCKFDVRKCWVFSNIEHVCPRGVSGYPCKFSSVSVKLLLRWAGILASSDVFVRENRAALELLSRCLCESSKPVMEYVTDIFCLTYSFTNLRKYGRNKSLLEL